MSETEHETIIRREGRAGRITLNRPKALNALRYQQVLDIRSALDRWALEPDVAVIVIDGAGERGLCAGGDVRELYGARETDPGLAARFWRDEYALNGYIHRYPKPIVAIMDGIVMGGGIGLSAHASHRIVTERSRLAMPETSIGLITDVGGTWLLANAPGRLGEYLGLLGRPMAAADAIYAGFADVHVATGDLDELIGQITAEDGEPVGVTIAETASPPAAVEHAALQSDIDRIFAGDSVTQILQALVADNAPEWAGSAASDLGKRSPLALALTLKAIRDARKSGSLEAALNVEFRLTTRLYQRGEFIEGVRALIIDKDHAPVWKPQSLDEVDDALVASYFAALEDLPELALETPA